MPDRRVEEAMALSIAAPWAANANRWLASHHGVISVATLCSFGVSRTTVRNMIGRGVLVPMLPGVLRSGHHPPGPEQWMVAASLRNPAATVGFVAAARLWGMRRLTADRRLHLLVPHGRSPEIEGAVVHRCRRIDPVDIVERDDGIRLTSPPRTLFDSADMLGVEAATSVLEQLIEGGRGAFTTHVDTWTRLAHPRRPGTRTMTEVLRARPAWQAALQSDLEARVLAEIRRQQLPLPLPQHRLSLGDAHQIRVDFAWPELRVALEVDHPLWHADSHRDRRRDRQLAAKGWATPRITNLDVDGGLAEAIGDVAAILDLAARRPA